MKSAQPSHFFLFAAFCVCQAAQASSVALNVSPNPSAFGSLVTLTATVSPVGATGKVTFYDGSQIIGLASVSGGVASLTTRQLSAGPQSIFARYDGDVNNTTALSGAFLTSVTAAAGSSFGSPAQYAIGINPCCVVSADFDRNGTLDTAVLSATSQEVFVQLGNGNGTFGASIVSPAGTTPISLAVGDFNGDGKPDLVVVSAGSPPYVAASIEILLGNGDGTFAAPVDYPASNAPYAVVVGDFNNDGYADVAVASESTFDQLSVYNGNGDGTLSAAVNYGTGTSNVAVGLTVGDFNGDGYPDLAVLATDVVIFLGSANGTFTIGQSLPAGSFPNGIQAADLNGDGKLDLVTADYAGAAVDVALGNGNGTFQTPVVYPVQTAPSSVLISDFNGDGKLDIVSADYETGSTGAVSLLLGNANGTFQAAQTFNAGPGAIAMALGDFNGDGIVDLAVADLGILGNNTTPGGLSILLGGCAAVSTVSPLAYDANGGVPVFTVTAGPSCSWTASSPVSWITLSQTSGTGNATVSATVAVYSPPPVEAADRSATITIAGTNFGIGEAFTVAQFVDVPITSYQFDAVNLLKEKGITNGCTPTDYCPTAPITRAQMAIFVVRAVYGGDDFTIQPIQYFTDVPPSAFGYMWIEKMFELGITNGCGPTSFCPDSAVTRDQMAVFIVRARFGASTNFTYSLTPAFVDVPMTDFAFKWVQRMKEDNITSGCTPIDYCPTSPVTRGDMAIFVMRGAFNQLLPSTEPIITSVTPTTLPMGGSATFTVMGLNTNFSAGTTVVNVEGGGVGGVGQPAFSITASNVTVISPTQLTVTLTSDPTAPAQPEAVYVQFTGGEAVEPNAVAVQAPPAP